MWDLSTVKVLTHDRAVQTDGPLPAKMFGGEHDQWTNLLTNCGALQACCGSQKHVEGAAAQTHGRAGNFLQHGQYTTDFCKAAASCLTHHHQVSCHDQVQQSEPCEALRTTREVNLDKDRSGSCITIRERDVEELRNQFAAPFNFRVVEIEKGRGARHKFLLFLWTSALF